MFNEAMEGAATVTLAALLAVMRVRHGDKHDYRIDHVYRPPITGLLREVFLIHASQVLPAVVCRLRVLGLVFKVEG